MSIKHTSVASAETCLALKSRGVGLTLTVALRTMFTVAFMLVVGAAIAQDQGENYHLFNPVPRDQMREFSIDRPDITEAPATVDAGHFQFEGDLLKLTKDQQGKSTRTLTIFSGLYKMGLSKSWDIHLGIEMYNIFQDPEGKTIDKGYGTTTVRLKHNFWGNDGESKTALGIIPYITFPSSADGEEVFGAGFPFSFGISEALGGGAQFQVDFLPDGKGGYDPAILQTFVVGGAVIGDLDFYAEIMGYFQESDDLFLANGGLIYNISDNVKVDVATNLGLTDTSPTRVYLGLSFRI